MASLFTERSPSRQEFESALEHRSTAHMHMKHKGEKAYCSPTLHVLCLATIISLQVISGCEKISDLSRAKAERMLEEQGFFKKPRSKFIYQSRGHELHIDIDPAKLDASCNNPNLLKPDEKELCSYWPAIKAGLLNLSISHQKVITGVTVTLASVALTPEGLKYSTGEHDDSGQGVASCYRKLLRVTGVSLMEFGQKIANVEFEYTYDRPTPFAPSDFNCEIGKVNKESANFVLYDDGWRIQQLR